MHMDEIGRKVRLTRKKSGFLQNELAALSGVGTRFLSELENGKGSLEIGRVMRVVETLGLELVIRDRPAMNFEQTNHAGS